MNSRETAFGNPDSVVRKRTDFSQPLLPAMTALERNLITDCYEPTTVERGREKIEVTVKPYRLFACGV